MRILHIISSMNPKAGGPVEGVMQMAHIHAISGVHVEVVCSDGMDETFLNKLPLKANTLGNGLGIYSFNNKMVGWIKENACRFDAIVVNGIWQYHGLAAWLALRNSKVPYFVYTHGMLDPWFKHTYPLKHVKKWMYWPWGVYPLLRDARAVLFTCEEERRLASQSFWLYKANERVVKYGAATPPQNAQELRDMFYAQYPELIGRRLFLFLSRIQEKKGCDILIEAFARVASLDPNIVLVMAGPDQTGWVARLKKLAVCLGVENRVVWPGMLLGDLKWGAFYASDIFVLPSHQENFGIAVAESLGCGVPVIISNKVNIWSEIVQDGAGLAGEDNVEDTIGNLRTWIGFSEEKRRAMRAQARKTFADRYTVQQMTASLVSTIKELL
ncbi:glycosyltransferase [Uliginosibacterium gangwonense]|uniref:glycosyltransferase n=1 Tax=Uliginosibacterium gangwonense TaxID=392736 RepID=UPI0003620C4B|nr:glycosyltransferase [Uliginosibacterium gangwonense]